MRLKGESCCQRWMRGDRGNAAMNELRFPALHIRPQGIKGTCQCGHRTSVSNPQGTAESRHGSRKLQIYKCCPDFQKMGTGEF